MAEACAMALLSQLKEACNGDLNKVKRVVKLGGFVASTPDFTDQPKIINGASDLFVKIFGEQGNTLDLQLEHQRFQECPSRNRRYFWDWKLNYIFLKPLIMRVELISKLSDIIKMIGII